MIPNSHEAIFISTDIFCDSITALVSWVNFLVVFSRLFYRFVHNAVVSLPCISYDLPGRILCYDFVQSNKRFCKVGIVRTGVNSITESSHEAIFVKDLFLVICS